ncbi:MAG: putative Ig domain-containing protein [Verrucomicrobia bacterium]|nr:putative Ig domain-containing protein [Verrucomicrobiota bacterium]
MKYLLAVLLAATFSVPVLTAAPLNDKFANATAIRLSSSPFDSLGVVGPSRATVTGSNVGATKEAGEPDHAGFAGGHSVWWTWVAPDNGVVTIDTAGSTIAGTTLPLDTTLAVYTGLSVDTLVVKAYDDDASATLVTSKVSFSVIKNQIYRIAVDGYSTVTGSIVLNVNLGPDTRINLQKSFTANDDFVDRASLAGDYLLATGDSYLATIETGETALGGYGSVIYGTLNSIWYTWTAPTSGTVSIATTETTHDHFFWLYYYTIIDVYEGDTLDTLTPAVDPVTLLDISNFAYSTSGTATVTVQKAVVAGETLQLRISDYPADSGAAVKLRISLDKSTGAPANDRFAKAALLTGSSAAAAANNDKATSETNELSPLTANASLWWVWVAPKSGVVTVNTTGSTVSNSTTTLDTMIGIYTGTTVSNLTAAPLTGGSNNTIGSTDTATFAVTAGTPYYIAVDSAVPGTTGDIKLNLAFTASAPVITTDLVNASGYAGQTATFSVTNTGQTPSVTPPIYVWQRKPAGTSTWSTVTSAGDYGIAATVVSGLSATSTLTISNLNSGMTGDQFRCVITNPAGQVTSQTATLSVISYQYYVAGAASMALSPGGTGKYFASGLPAGLTLDATTGLVTGTITAKPGSYTVTYWRQSAPTVKRTMIITVTALPSGLQGSFEGLFVDGTGAFVGKLQLLVSSTGAYSGTMTYQGRFSALKGILNLTPVSTGTDLSVTTKGGVDNLPVVRVALNTVSLTFSINIATSALTASLTNGSTTYTLVDGTTIPTLTSVAWAKTYTLVFGTPTGIALSGGQTAPEGAGYGLVTINSAGLMKLTGKTADGTVLTASAASDSSASYRFFLPIYKNGLGYLAGFMPLSTRTDGNYHLATVAGTDFYWSKPADSADTSYPLGFGMVGLDVSMEPWIVQPDAWLIGPLGLYNTSNIGGFNLALAHSTAGVSNASPNTRILPTTLLLSATSTVSVTDDSTTASVNEALNPNLWTVKINRSTGLFTGSFRLTDTVSGKVVTRTVPVEGVLQQLPGAIGNAALSSGVKFGQGFFLLPPTVSTGKTVSGKVEFAAP